jgi:hypothetical protein
MAVGAAKTSNLKVQIVEADKVEKLKDELRKLLDHLAASNCEVYSIQYQVDNGKYSFAVIFSFEK